MVGDRTSNADVMCFDAAFSSMILNVDSALYTRKKVCFDVCHTCLDLFQTDVALCSNYVCEVKSEVLALKHNQSAHVSLYVKIVALYTWQIWALIFARSESGAVSYCNGLTFRSFGERTKPQQLFTRCKITLSGLLVGVMAISYLHRRVVNSAFLNDSYSTLLACLNEVKHWWEAPRRNKSAWGAQFRCWAKESRKGSDEQQQFRWGNRTCSSKQGYELHASSLASWI